jgi:cation diffusion facilitator family transporter
MSEHKAHTGHEHGAGDHAHGSGSHDHGPGGHSHGGVSAAIHGSHEAMRTLKLSLLILGATAALQVVVVILSGSVALLADTVHNVGDALTAIPLAAAFILGRRLPTNRLTYGYGRAEDLAGLAVLALILFSAIFAGYEAIQRLINPSTPSYLVAVALAGLIGFAGNEWVAVYRIRSGRRIGSAALVADGYHARVDGFTSLAVVAGAAGVALGYPLADPIVGTSAKDIGLRIMDGIEPERIEEIRHEAGHVEGVIEVGEVRARWLGHQVRAEINVVVPADTSVETGHEIAVAVRARLIARVEFLEEALVHVDPPSAAGESHHAERAEMRTHPAPAHLHPAGGHVGSHG